MTDPGQLDAQQRKIWDEFVAMPGDEFEFAVERMPEAIARDPAGTTFSADAVDQLSNSMSLFVVSRLYRALTVTRVTPAQMRVRVRVVFNSENSTLAEHEDYDAQTGDPGVLTIRVSSTPKKGSESDADAT